MPSGTVNNIKEAYLKFHKFVLMKIRIKSHNFGWFKNILYSSIPKCALVIKMSQRALGHELLFGKPRADSWSWHKAFGNGIFGRAVWARRTCSSIWIQATEMQLCHVWRCDLISRSHSDVSPSLYLIQIAFSLRGSDFPKLCQGK